MSREPPHLPESPLLPDLRSCLCCENPCFLILYFKFRCCFWLSCAGSLPAQNKRLHPLSCNRLRLLCVLTQVNETVVRLKCDRTTDAGDNCVKLRRRRQNPGRPKAGQSANNQEDDFQPQRKPLLSRFLGRNDFTISQGWLSQNGRRAEKQRFSKSLQCRCLAGKLPRLNVVTW